MSLCKSIKSINRLLEKSISICTNGVGTGWYTSAGHARPFSSFTRVLTHTRIRVIPLSLLLLFVSRDVFAQHWFAIGSRLSGGGDLVGAFGFLFFVCPMVWLFLRFYLNKLGSYLFDHCRQRFWCIFWRDYFGVIGATIGVILCIVLVLMIN